MSNILVVQREARRRKRIRARIIGWVMVLAALLIGALIIGKRYLPREDKTVLTEARTMETLEDEIVPGTIPTFFQYDDRWRYKIYGDGTMEFNGCGPTCLSMVLCGLYGTAEYDPLTVARFADDEGYYAEGAGSAWTLMSEGAREMGLDASEVTFDRKHITGELQKGNPIICVMGPGDFTTTGHYIVLTGIDENGMVTVHDPNSRERSDRKWSLEELMPQMKNLWSYRKPGA